jgi:hypothetical protein
MESKQRDTDELMGLNHLKYEVPANLALAQEGSIFKKNNADIQQYSSQSGTELIVTLQSSTDFVYGPNCYLRFDVRADGLVSDDGADPPVAVAAGLGFLNSPATALFERFLLEDKSGAEIERVEDLNKAVRSILPWKYPQDYLGTATAAGQFSAPVVGGTANFDATGASVTQMAVNDPADPGTGSLLRVCIPLWYFSGMFKEETLIPPSLISGARFRLTLAPAREALSLIGVGTGALGATYDDSALSYTIVDPVIMLDTYSMATSVQRNIMEQMGSVDGVPFTYCSLYNQTAQPATSTDFTLQINKAVARAEKIYVSTQNTIPDDSKVDNLGTQRVGVFQYQARVGDWYAPQQVLQAGTTDSKAGVQRNCSELFTNALQCTHGLSDPYHSSVTLTQFRGNAKLAATDEKDANGGYGVLVQTLNQSPHIGDAGIAINNSRTAEVRIRYAADNAAEKSITSWLEYIKLACVYPMRTVVKQ